MMLKKKIKNERDPIDLTVEKNINKVGSAIVWAIKTPVRFWFTVPKNKYDRDFKKMEIIGWFFIGIGVILVSLARAHVIGW